MEYSLTYVMTVFVFVLCLTIVSTGLVQAEDAQRGVRAPQHKRLQYQTPDGSKVNSKYYSPDTQWRSRQESNSRLTRQEVVKNSPVAAPVRTQQPEAGSFYQYKPFSEVPDHIKQLIYQVYTPQVPYVNPYAFLYDMNLAPVSQDISAEHSTTPQSIVDQPITPTALAYRTNYPIRSRATTEAVNKTPTQGRIAYKDNSRNTQSHYGERQLYSRQQQQQQDQTKRSLEKNIGDHHQAQYYQQNVPNEIQQLLQYQAQIPYNVLANQINFQFQKPFVPKPLPDATGKSSHYPTIVYYIKSNGEVVDSAAVRDVPGIDIKYRNA